MVYPGWCTGHIYQGGVYRAYIPGWCIPGIPTRVYTGLYHLGYTGCTTPRYTGCTTPRVYHRVYNTRVIPQGVQYPGYTTGCIYHTLGYTQGAYTSFPFPCWSYASLLSVAGLRPLSVLFSSRVVIPVSLLDGTFCSLFCQFYTFWQEMSRYMGPVSRIGTGNISPEQGITVQNGE